MEITNVQELSKEELIEVIAEMHDTIQEWDYGYGLPPIISSALINVGRACVNYSTKKKPFSIEHLASLDIKVTKKRLEENENV